jgi:hypothetical protein
MPCLAKQSSLVKDRKFVQSGICFAKEKGKVFLYTCTINEITLKPG